MKKLLFLSTLLALPLHAAITFVQSPAACVSTNGSTSLTCTFAQPVAAGDILILVTNAPLAPRTSPFVVSATDTLNGSWQSGAQCFQEYGDQANFFYRTNTAAGSDSVTVTYSGLQDPTKLYISMAEYSGVNNTVPFDGAPLCSAFQYAPPYVGPGLTTSQATDTLISALVLSNSGKSVVSSPYIDRVPHDDNIADAAATSAGYQPGPTWAVQYKQSGFVIGIPLQASGISGPTVVTVGPNGEYPTPCAAFAHLSDGDTVQIDANGGTPYQDTADCTITNNNLMIVGVSGRPIMDASKATIARAIWDVDGHDDVIDNFEFRNANNSSKDSTSAAAIRIEDSDGAGGTTPAGGNITVKRSYIHDNFNGVVSNDAGNGSGAWNSSTPFISLMSDEFANNGYGDGKTHNISIGYGGDMDFTLQSSWSHDAYVGNEVKSRAPINNIRYNLIGDSVGNSGYLVDLPNGGSSYVVGNSFYKLATTNPNANAGLIMFADVNDNTANDPEYPPSNQDLHFVNNTAVMDPANADNPSVVPPAFLLVGCNARLSSSCTAPVNGPELTVPSVVENDIFFGAEPETTNQDSAFQENDVLDSNSSSTALAALELNNPTVFDFRLKSGSTAIGAGINPPTNNAGNADPSALPTEQYVHPETMTTWPTPSGNTMDAGAFSSAVPISSPSLQLGYPSTVQGGTTGSITVSGLPTPAAGQYNYASFLSGNQAIVSGISSTLGSPAGEGDIESAASSGTSVTTTFTTSQVTKATAVPVYIYVDGTVLTASVTVEPATGTAASIAAVSGSGQSAAVGSDFSNPLVVVVKDSNGNAVSGATVSFTGTGVSFPAGATAVTGSNGEAQVTAQATATGALTVNASLSGVSGSVSFSETGTASGPAGTIVFVQAPAACSSGSNNSVTSWSCTFTKPVAAGDTLILSTMPVLTPGTTPFAVSVSDTVNGAWPQGTLCYAAYSAQASFFVFPNTAAGTDTVTVTYSGMPHAAPLVLGIAEYSGVNTSNPIDGTPACSPYLPQPSSSPYTYTGPNLVTTQANDMLLSTLVVGNTGVTTVSSPYVMRGAQPNPIADHAAGAAGTQYSPTWTGQYRQDGFVINAALQPAGSGAGVGPPASIAAVSGSGQSAAVGSDFSNPLVVVVKDSNGNAVSGATVSFTGTGVSFPAGATAVTGSNGEAQVTAQATATGALTVNAGVSGVSGSVSFSETGTASSGTGTIAFVQAPAACSNGSNSSVTSWSCTFAKPVAAGDTLILSTMPVLTPGTTPFAVSVSDTVNGAWPKGTLCYAAYSAQASFFVLPSTAAGSDTVTVTYSGMPHAAPLVLGIAEYSGVNTSNPIDGTPACSPYLPQPNSSPYTYTGPNLVTTQANDMLLSTLVVGNTGVTTVSSPYVMRTAQPNPIADYAAGAAGTQYSPTWTGQYRQDGFVINAALQPAAQAQVKQ